MLLLAISVLASLVLALAVRSAYRRAVQWRVVIKPGTWHPGGGPRTDIKGFCICIKRFGKMRFVDGVDQRIDSFPDDLAEAISKAEYRARELNAAQKLSRKALH